ncbi:MAG TPA: DMT family transporter [Melioribacteraceae bacterium]|nr:DMT family transporter [Melioribacteraceae bacterium]
MKKETLLIVLGYIAICLLWGSTWLAIKVGLESLTPFISSGARFITAALFFFIIIKLRNIKVVTDKLAIKLYLIMGFFSFAIPFGLVYWGQKFIPSGLASILFAVYPFFVIIFTKLFFKEENVNVYKIIGSIIGFSGIIVIFSDSIVIQSGVAILGLFAVVLSAIMQAFVAVVLKKYGKKLNPVSMNLFPVLIAGLLLTITGLLTEDTSKLKLDNNAILSVLYLASFGTIATFSTYYWLMKKISVVLLAISAFITPIVSVLLGWLILNEKLSFQEIMGSILVLFGILTANLKGLMGIMFKGEK